MTTVVIQAEAGSCVKLYAIPIALTVCPSSPISGSAKMFHIAPTTFHGISSGSAISTRQTDTQGPVRGMVSAMATPSGISMIRITPVKTSWRTKEAWNRSEVRICSYHLNPSKKKTLSPNVSWKE